MEHTSESGQSGVEVTPEMVRAGVAVMLEYYSDDLQDAAELVVNDVFSAMVSAMKSSSQN